MGYVHSVTLCADGETNGYAIFVAGNGLLRNIVFPTGLYSLDLPHRQLVPGRCLTEMLCFVQQVRFTKGQRSKSRLKLRH